MMRAALWLAIAAPLAAQPKLLVNAQLKTEPAAPGLEAAFRRLAAAQQQPAWIGYAVPAVRSPGLGCDYVRDNFAMPGVIHLEPPDHAVILFRVEGGAVNRIRTLSPDCEIDAGGLPVYWLNDVEAAQSVALLMTFTGERERAGESAGAIAYHAGAAADQALDRLASAGQPEWLRMRAVSLEGQTRGRHGFEFLKQAIAAEADERVRERAVSSLAGSREPDAGGLLVSIARSDKNPKLREQALAALARKGGPAALETLTKAIDTDPDPQVRRRAVSALNALPDGAGIPVLIEVVRNADNAEVRKQAMSVLSGSRDPRAAAFFEEVLKKE